MYGHPEGRPQVHYIQALYPGRLEGRPGYYSRGYFRSSRTEVVTWGKTLAARVSIPILLPAKRRGPTAADPPIFRLHPEHRFSNTPG